MITAPKYSIKDNGDCSVCITFEAPIGKTLSQFILQLSSRIKSNLAEPVVECIPAYNSVVILYDSLQCANNEFKHKLKQQLTQPFEEIDYASNLINIPVCYENKYAPDIELLASTKGLTIDALIAIHTSTTYLVHMLGFLPGFVYLGGLDKRLHCHRKPSPRTRIVKGSVAIGGEQTGIYPIDSPGGWQIIGRTPVTLFNPEAAKPFLANPLDRIKFKAITALEFERLEAENHGD